MYLCVYVLVYLSFSGSFSSQTAYATATWTFSKNFGEDLVRGTRFRVIFPDDMADSLLSITGTERREEKKNQKYE